MLRQFTREDQSNGGLNLSWRNRWFLGVGSKLCCSWLGDVYRCMTCERWLTGSFGSDTFEDIVYEGVQDSHCFIGDTGVRVDLLQHWSIRTNNQNINKGTRALAHTLIDIRAVSLPADLLPLLLFTITWRLGLLCSLLGCLGPSVGGGLCGSFGGSGYGCLSGSWSRLT